MLPIVLDMTRRLCLVVGAGQVGRRKAAALLAGGAAVRIVCLDERPQDCNLGDGLPAERVEWLHEPYETRHLDRAALAVAAGPADVNRQVVADARARGVWVNNAAEAAAGDFALPAVVRRGELVLSVSTGAAAPGLAAVIRDQLARVYDEPFGRWVGLLTDVRRELRDQDVDPAARREVMRRLSGLEWLGRLRRDGEASTRAAAWREAAGLVPNLRPPV